ncbi:hypothetical protein GGH92_006461 [Coemansia sp. RSA 2673]|nr:hypothetical protein GGH92_006461 [Coemansia sp. RSA 2673]
MLARTISTLALTTIYSVAALPNQPAGTHAVPTKRCDGCGGYGVYGGYRGYGAYGGYGGYGRYGGYPFVSSFTSNFDLNSNCANFNKNTLYVNNVNANTASDNVHTFTNANIIA